MSASAFTAPAWLPAPPRLPPWTSRAARQTLGGLIVAAASGALALSMVHHTTLKGVAVVIVVVGSVWFATNRSPQLALAVLMLYLGLLDGYLKLATGSDAVTFVRDAFIFALVVGLLIRATVQAKPLPLPPLSAWVIAFVVIVFVQIANPRAGTLAHSLAGVRQHLEFVPLFFLTFAFVRTKRALRTFCVLLVVIAVPNAIANWVQFNETPQQFAAWGPGYSQRVFGTASTFVGGGRTFTTASGVQRTRPFGLGSDAGDGGLFCALALSAILALAVCARRRRDLLLAVAMALATVLGILTSEGRGVVISSVVAVAVFGLLTLRSRKRLRSLLGLVLVLIASLFMVEALASGSTSFRYAGLAPSSLLKTTSTARGSSITVIPYNLTTFPFGAGLGTAGPASSAPGASATTLYGSVNTETEFSFLTVETGIAGILVLTGFVIVLLSVGARRLRQVSDSEARVLLAALIAPVAACFALFFSSIVTTSVPIGPYLWAVGGIVSYWLIALPQARRREEEASAASSRGAGAARPTIAVAGARSSP